MEKNLPEYINMLLYNPKKEFIVTFENGKSTRTLKIKTPENGRNPKGTWFLKTLEVANEYPDNIPNNLPQLNKHGRRGNRALRSR